MQKNIAYIEGGGGRKWHDTITWKARSMMGPALKGILSMAQKGTRILTTFRTGMRMASKASGLQPSQYGVMLPSPTMSLKGPFSCKVNFTCKEGK